MKELNRYRFKIIARSPLHIGSGKVYEPTNFVIDDGKLYEFDEMLFYKALKPIDRRKFINKLQDWIEIIKFYKEHRNIAKTISIFSLPVTDSVEKRYNTVINKDGTRNTNQFEIQRIQRNPNSRMAIIPGSSIKGMLDTVLGIYPTKIKDNTPRRKLIVSDALQISGESEIGYAYRVHKNPDKKAKSEIPQIVEIVKKETVFIVTISSEHSFEEIREKMRNYIQERGETRFSFSTDNFIARIGRFSGKAYMVDDGNNVLNSYNKPIATHTLYERDREEFGWIEFLRIDDDEYHKYLDEIREREKEYRMELEERHKEVIENIERLKEEKQKEKERKLRREREEEERIARERAEEDAKLKAMTEVEKLIYNYGDIPSLINDMRAGNIENFEDIKVELAQKIKEELQKDPSKWDRAKKKALARKEYIESILK